MRRAPLALSLALALVACSKNDDSSSGSAPSAASSQGGSSQAGSSGSQASSGSGGSSGSQAASGSGGSSGKAAGGSSGKSGSGGSSGSGSGSSKAGAAGSGGSSGAGAGASGSGAGGSGAGSGGTVGALSCDPPAKPGEIYALSADSLDQLDPISMCDYRGKVMLIVNVASECGYTPEYGPLQKLYDTYKDQGFVVLGFPCNQFGGQEPGSDKDISTFCTQSYGITFPMFTKIEVNGPNEHPIYTWLKSQPGGSGDIPWNFTKFLVGRDGKLVARIPTETYPDKPEVVAQIEAALAVK